MMIRSDGDVILAVNLSRDIGELALRWVYAYREICNGMWQVVIPKGNLFIGFPKQTMEGYLLVTVIAFHEEFYSREISEPVYDLGSGGFGGSSPDPEGILYYSKSTETERIPHCQQVSLKIKNTWLLDPNYRQVLIDGRKKYNEDQAALKRAEEIKKLKEQVAKLEAQQT